MLSVAFFCRYEISIKFYFNDLNETDNYFDCKNDLVMVAAANAKMFVSDKSF